MLDNIWYYELGQRNLLSLDDCKPPLPCQEVLWEAETALQWQHIRGYSVCKWLEQSLRMTRLRDLQPCHRSTQRIRAYT